MNARILIVDDEPNVLLAFRRTFSDEFSVCVARDGPQGLLLVESEGLFAVIVSDLRMPGMDGIEFLKRVRELSPESVRIMMTGVADQETVIAAAHEAAVFRFLAKPCSSAALGHALQAAVRYHRLLTAEREFKETLADVIDVLAAAFAMMEPATLAGASTVRRWARALARELRADDSWLLDIAALLFATDAEFGQLLIADVPHLERAAAALGYLHGRPDHSRPGPDTVDGAWAVQAARILEVAHEYAGLTGFDVQSKDAVAELRSRNSYDALVLDALERLIIAEDVDVESRMVRVDELARGMVLTDGVCTEEGTVIVAAGEEVTDSLIARLENSRSLIQAQLTVEVRSPTHRGAPEGEAA